MRFECLSNIKHFKAYGVASLRAGRRQRLVREGLQPDLSISLQHLKLFEALKASTHKGKTNDQQNQKAHKRPLVSPPEQTKEEYLSSLVQVWVLYLALPFGTLTRLGGALSLTI